MLVCALAAGLVAASLATGPGASPERGAGLYPGLAVPEATQTPAHVPTRMPAASTTSPAPPASLTPSPLPATPTPTPVVLAATAKPAPSTPPATVTPAVMRSACPAYPILLDPAPDLVSATRGATEMWDTYLGCPAFKIVAGGLQVQYEPAWPGDCLDADIAACTMNGVFLSPMEPLYHPQSVIAHELGHVLNFEHGEGPAVMDPARWSGPGTVWCDLDIRCGP
ncbi:MAG TPA: hypothetical protein VMR52_08625 [Dehalococcoidia bacterium]|nr:hypothetical protein [Dehalococcoidia bacterium]